MPVRSVNLKLVVPRNEDGRAVRMSLWTTHAEVNAATAYYERWLLLLRGQGYQGPQAGTDEPAAVSTDDVQRQAVEAARAAQRANIARLSGDDADPGTNAEILAALRALFDLLAPEETGAASAQAANAYLSPLTDPASAGFASAAAKLERPRPNWLSLPDDDPQLLDAATAWFEADASAPWRSDTGSPAGWLRAARASSATWPQLFRKKLDELTKATGTGPEAVIAKLRALHLLPLFPPYFQPRMREASGGVTPWDRLAFRLAVSHILSWQAWVRRAADQHGERVRRLKQFEQSFVTGRVADCLPSVRAFENDRSRALSGLGLGDATYALMPRQLRGWDDLRGAWRKAKDLRPETLLQIAADHQTRKRGRFGDPHVFSWLAQPAQHALWFEDDVLSIAAALNSMQALVARSRETAIMTLPDARLHPRAVQWSSEGDSNLRPYRLIQLNGNRLMAELSLLRRDEATGKLDDVRETFTLAPSQQFVVQGITKRGKKAVVAFATGTEQFAGVIGSADLLFDRQHLQRRRPEGMAHGVIGPVWLKVALDLDPMLPTGWQDDHARFTRHFVAALGKPTKAEGSVCSGQRVLSVDLGIRSFAACSVFVLTDVEPTPSAGREASLAFPVHANGSTFWATHERSFLLTLPDEKPGRDGEQWRTEARARLRRVRLALGHYRSIGRLTGLPLDDRRQQWDTLRAALEGGDPLPFQEPILAALERHLGAPLPVWEGAISEALRAYRQGLGPVIRHWRRAGKERQAFNHIGKSMWAVEYLTDVRRTLMTWSLLGRMSGEVRRLDRAARGAFASGLLHHLENMKEDRLKTGADLIVRAAMGFVRDKAGRWQQRFRPCNAILFEDLSRYRMRTDRPRRENSQLMRWAHRAVPAEVTMQGALFGLEVLDTSAAFSSRYYARTMTPGLRCRELSTADLADERLRQDLLELKIDLAACRAGDLVPYPGGEVFACLTKSGGLVRVNADINAAQNLQRRFWTRHGDAFRLPCVRATLDGAEVWVPRAMGKRLAGALGGPGVLRPTGHLSGSCVWETIPAARFRRLAGRAFDGDETAAVDLETEDLAALTEDAEVQAGRVEVFFRDPSGVVMPERLWYPGKTAWSIVRTRTVAGLKSRLGAAVGSE
jgi:hypothetical protein